MEIQTPAYSRTPASYILRRFLLMAALLLAVLLLYTFLHEGGHALLGLAFGGRLTDFSVRFWDLSAHAGLQGNFSAWQRSLISLGGVGLPLLASVLFLALTPKKADLVLEWFRLLGAAFAFNALLAWIVTPFLYMAGRAPGDDSTSFLDHSSMPPLLVASFALVIYLWGWVLLMNKLDGLAGLRSRLRLLDSAIWTPVERKSLARLGVACAGLAALALGVNRFYPFADQMAGPEGYSPAFTLNLAARGYEAETVYHFTLEEAGKVSLFFALENFQAGPTRITLAGPNGYSNTFLRFGEGFRADYTTVHPQRIPLGAGEYDIIVTFPRSQGKVAGFLLRERP